MELRRANPGDDLVSDLLAAQAAGAPISDGEILHNMFALLVAGHLTTADLIGNGAMLLLTHPEARAKIKDNPALIASAVDEMMRFEPPISTTARFPHADGALGGCPYQKGDALTVSVLAKLRLPFTMFHPAANNSTMAASRPRKTSAWRKRTWARLRSCSDRA